MALHDNVMTTSSDTTATHTFSTGQNLSGWLTRLGAPALPEGHTYRLLLEPADRNADHSPTKVTAFIYAGDVLVGQASEITRVDSSMAAVAAARHAFEGMKA